MVLSLEVNDLAFAFYSSCSYLKRLLIGWRMGVCERRVLA